MHPDLDRAKDLIKARPEPKRDACLVILNMVNNGLLEVR
jgi:hypothetical protein